MKLRHGLESIVIIVALAQGSTALADGINLSWNDCGVAGTRAVHFGCETNDGPPYELFVSFSPPVVLDLDEVIGISATIDFYPSGRDAPAVPNWWRIGAEECRRSKALQASADFERGPYACESPYWGAHVSLGQQVSHDGYRTRLIMTAAWDESTTPFVPDPQVEYYAFRIRVARTSTVGAGACAGCELPVCIFAREVQLFQPLRFNFDPRIFNSQDRPFTSWHNANLSFPDYRDPLIYPYWSCSAGQTVSTRPVTWGRIKSLYR